MARRADSERKDLAAVEANLPVCNDTCFKRRRTCSGWTRWIVGILCIIAIGIAGWSIQKNIAAAADSAGIAAKLTAHEQHQAEDKSESSGRLRRIEDKLDELRTLVARSSPPPVGGGRLVSDPTQTPSGKETP